MDQLKQLKKIADTLEAFYNRPIDCEFVIKDDTIYLVQARPRVYTATTTLQKPSYLKDIDQNAKIYAGTTILGSGGFVRKIKTPQEVISANTLDQALNRYLTMNLQERALVKLIIVGDKTGQRPAANSHPAIVLRSLTIPVFFIRNSEPLQKALDAQEPLIFSPQQEIIVNVENIQKPSITQGWARYQAPQQLSAIPDFFIEPTAFDPAPYKTCIEGLAQNPTPAFGNILQNLSTFLSPFKQTNITENKGVSFNTALFASTIFIAGYGLKKLTSYLNPPKTVITDFDQYGAKGSNLVLLKELFSKEKNVAIPSFYLFSSGDIKRITQENGLDLDARWEILRKTIKSPKDFEIARSKFENNIISTFKKAAEKCKQNNKFSFKETYGIKKLDTYLKSLPKDTPLILRSSGEEDSETNTNAGGNKSIAPVSNSPAALLEYAGVVIASYVSAKSLGQQNLLKNTLPKTFSTPLIVQALVVETDPKKPIRSGVMFTEDPEGSVDDKPVYDENKKIVTTKITIINATWGSNEAVVSGSSNDIDSFYLLPADPKKEDLIIHPIIAYKKNRLTTSTKTGKLVRKNNPSALTTAPSLTLNQLKQLKKIADTLEAFYNRPIDCEFVIKDDTIYLVQARPRVYTATTTLQKPSYLKDIDQNAKIYAGTTILGSGGFVRKIKTPQEVISANTLDQALNRYLTMNLQERALVKLIIVGDKTGQRPAANSHPAIVLRSLTIPVFFIRNSEPLQKALDAQEPLIFSPQQEIIVNVENIQKPSITQGWARYQAPQQLSAIPDFFIEPTAFDPAPYKTCIEGLAQNPTPALWEKANTSTNPHEQKAALLTIFARYTNEKNAKLPLQRHLRALVGYNLANPLKTAEDQKRWLITIAFIKNGLSQTGSTEVVNAYTSARNYPTNDTLGKILQELTALARSESLKKNIIWFLERLREKNLVYFATLIGHLNKLNILPEWLHTSFAQEIKNHGDCHQKLLNLVKELESTQSFLTDIVSLRTKINQWNPLVFSESTQFDKQFEKIETIAGLLGNAKTYEQNSFVEAFEKTSALGKMTALETMRLFVDKFDLSIKALIGNPANINKLGAEQFKKMLTLYSSILHVWLQLVDLNDLNINGTLFTESLGSQAKNDKTKVLEAFLNPAQEILQQVFTEEDFSLTPSFNVMTCLITSGFNPINRPNLTYPATGADAFTILHQNYEALLTILGKKAGLFTFERPQPLARLEEYITTNWSSRVVKNKPMLIGTSIGQPHKTSVYYNIPLRHHSMTFSATYYDDQFPVKALRNCIKITNTFTGSPLAGDGKERWKIFSVCARIYAEIHPAEIKAYIEPLEDKLTITYSGQEQAIKSALNYLESIVLGPLGLAIKNKSESPNETFETFINKLNSKERYDFFDRFYRTYSVNQLEHLPSDFRIPLITEENILSFLQKAGDTWSGFKNPATLKTMITLFVRATKPENMTQLKQIEQFLNIHYLNWKTDKQIINLLWEDMGPNYSFFQLFKKNPSEPFFQPFIQLKLKKFMQKALRPINDPTFLEKWFNEKEPNWPKDEAFIKELWEEFPEKAFIKNPSHSFWKPFLATIEKDAFSQKIAYYCLMGVKCEEIVEKITTCFDLLNKLDPSWMSTTKTETIRTIHSCLKKHLGKVLSVYEDNKSLSIFKTLLTIMPKQLVVAGLKTGKSAIIAQLLDKDKPDWRTDKKFITKLLPFINYYGFQIQSPDDFWEPFLTAGLPSFFVEHKTTFKTLIARLQDSWLQEKGKTASRLEEICDELKKLLNDDATDFVKKLPECAFKTGALKYFGA